MKKSVIERVGPLRNDFIIAWIMNIGSDVLIEYQVCISRRESRARQIS